MDKQIGMEATPAEYVARMVEVFRLVREALAPWGTVWLNIGDSYGQQQGKGFNGQAKLPDRDRNMPDAARLAGLAPGNLCLIPWRLAIALQDDGWIVRSVVVWHKPAPMPASLAGWKWCRCRVKVESRSESKDPRGGFRQGTANRDGHDGSAHRVATWADCPGCKRCEPHGGYVLRRGSWRPTSSWEPVLMLAKAPGYFADGESVKVPASTAPHSPGYVNGADYAVGPMFRGGHSQREDPGRVWGANGGANLRDVWTIPETMCRLRKDLTPEQRAYVLRRMLGGGSPSS